MDIVDGTLFLVFWVIEEAGVRDSRWHDMRHYAESRIMPSVSAFAGEALAA